MDELLLMDRIAFMSIGEWRRRLRRRNGVVARLKRWAANHGLWFPPPRPPAKQTAPEKDDVRQTDVVAKTLFGPGIGPSKW